MPAREKPLAPAGVLAVLTAALATACDRGPLEWPEVLAGVRAEHPEVRQVSIDELRARPDGAVLLDARSEAEYAVSHLEGALWSPDEGVALRHLAGVDPEREIVVYCSVGMRSSDLAEELHTRGFTRVGNLEGGIFAWANAGHPLVRGEEPADVVHPYDQRWGALLLPERRAALER